MTPPRLSTAARSAARRGIALVITLLMLSVVTITAVAFLAVSRRERDSVATYAEQSDARFVAEAGLNHAQARLTSRMAAATNRLAYGGFMVSTNYINPFFRLGLSYVDTRNFRSLTNVSYFRTNGQPLFDLSTDNGRQTYARMLGNLYYDPRPPVFVQTNRNPNLVNGNPWDFRFYLDLNRNGRFDTNGWQWPRDQVGRIFGQNQEFLWGDPEWIGLLQYPDAPHSGTNHFIGRFAYVVVPTARALDVNYIGNDAKRLNLGVANPAGQLPLLGSGFLRNQGVGSWEINTAGFLAGLNTNIWLAGPNDYVYRTNLAETSTGLAFSDAERLRRFRQENVVPRSAEAFYAFDSGRPDDARIDDVFRRDFVDGYSDGPMALTVADVRQRLNDNDLPGRPWPGSDLTNQFVELNDLFRPELGVAYRLTGQYTNNAGVRQTSPFSTYDAHTFYRLISQLGTDSSDSRFETGLHPAYSDLNEASTSRPSRPASNPYGFYRRPKLNLNYGPDVPGDTGPNSVRIANFREWQPSEWFTNAAHRLLLSEFNLALPFRPPGLNTNVPGLAVYGPAATGDIDPGLTNQGARVLLPVGRGVQTNYTYDAQVHRWLQVAANIYDGANNRFIGSGADRVALPSVFRPLFYRDSRTPGVLRLHGFQEILGGTEEFLNRWRWVTPGQAINSLSPSLPEDNETSRTDFNVFGMPWVVGAKKGLPSFNEALWQTVVQPTRRLRVIRTSAQDKLNPGQLPFDDVPGSKFRTEFQYLLNITNLVGLEAWNAYPRQFNRPVRIFATNVMDMVLRDETDGPGGSLLLMQRRELLRGSYLVRNGWGPYERISPGFLRTGEALSDPQRFVMNRDVTSPHFVETPTTIPSSARSIPGGFSVGTAFIYDAEQRILFPPNRTNEGWVRVTSASTPYQTPVLSAYVTNHLVFAITDQASGRLLDFVTLESVMVRTNVLTSLALSSSVDPGGFFGSLPGAGTQATPQTFWQTRLVQGNRTQGIDNQMQVATGQMEIREPLWSNLNSPGGGGYLKQREDSIAGMNFFLYGIGSAAALRDYASKTTVQVGFNPSPRVFMVDRRMANDPLVHYTRDDLVPGYLLATDGPLGSLGYTEFSEELFAGVPIPSRPKIVLTTNAVAFDLGPQPKAISAFAPWGTNANLGSAQPSLTNSTAFNYAYKDPQIRVPDDWSFPVGTNPVFRYAGIGQLGRIHRGTPWQTIYLKSLLPAPAPSTQSSVHKRYTADPLTWEGWAGNRRTSPTNDWKILDLFTTAFNENAARGQLGVNQTNVAAWSALLASVPLLRNDGSDGPETMEPFFLEPGSPEMQEMFTGRFDQTVSEGTNTFYFSLPGIQSLFVPPVVTIGNGIREVRTFSPDAESALESVGPLQSLGEVLRAPMLSDRAPFLRVPGPRMADSWSRNRSITDEVLERLPQQVLSLLRTDEPRFVIYAYGQTLKPAPNAVNLRPGPLYGITTNYTITGEYVTKTTLRLDGDPRRIQPVIESQRVVFSNP